MRRRRGFTLVEVSLFLAVTGLLFLGVTIGVQNSIYQQRYSDTVQGFANFLRNIYDEVVNVQSVSNGRHGTAIYGKLVTFGETEDKQSFFVYDVLGRAANSSDLGSGTTLSLLKQLGVTVAFRDNEEEPYKPVGIIEEYTPSWGAKIQPTDSFTDYKGTLLMVRDPRSGTVRTFVRNEATKVSDLIENASEPTRILIDILDAGGFAAGEVDFCVNPNGDEESNNRTDVRLLDGASNASGVEIIDLDSDENRCR